MDGNFTGGEEKRFIIIRNPLCAWNRTCTCQLRRRRRVAFPVLLLLLLRMTDAAMMSPMNSVRCFRCFTTTPTSRAATSRHTATWRPALASITPWVYTLCTGCVDNSRPVVLCLVLAFNFVWVLSQFRFSEHLEASYTKINDRNSARMSSVIWYLPIWAKMESGQKFLFFF